MAHCKTKKKKKETWEALHLSNAKNYFVVGSVGWVMPTS